MALDDDAKRRTEEAFARAGLSDVRALYRGLLVRLRAKDAGAYEEAVRKYETEVLPALGDGARDPVRVWIGYGRWLAGQICPGDVMEIDAVGRARPCGADDELALPALILHFPEASAERALTLAVPTDPTEAQQVTIELLAGR